MKKLLLSCLLLIAFTVTKTQTINSISHLPVSATTNDQVLILINTTFSYNCVSDSFVYNIVGNQIYINMYQCLGMLSIICTKTDTVNVGQLTAGTKSVQVLIHTAQAMPNCAYGPPFPPNMNYSFTVSPFTDVAETKNNFSMQVFPNPSSGNVYFKYNVSQNAQLEIYNLVGEKIKSYTLISGSNEVVIKNGELKSGIYFAKVITGNKETTVQKFTIIE